MTRDGRGWAGMIAGCCALMLAAAAADGQTTPSTYQLAMAGNDQILWLVRGEYNAENRQFVNYFSYIEKGSWMVRPALSIPAQVGQLERWTVVEDDLFVFYSTGSHHSYGRGGERRELRLPGRTVPLAIAAGPARRPGAPATTSPSLSALWAVVDGVTAERIAENWRERNRSSTAPATAPAETRPGGDEQPQLTPAAAPPPAIVQYTGAEWIPGIPLPPEAHTAERFWLAAGGRRFHLLWVVNGRTPEIRYAWCENEEWTAGPSFQPTDVPRDAFLSIVNRQLVFCGLVPVEGNARVLRPDCWMRQAIDVDGTMTPWSQTPVAKTPEGTVLTTPGGTVVAAFGDSMVLLRMNDTQTEIGSWLLSRGGPPDQPFRVANLRRGFEDGGRSRRVNELVTAIAVGAIVLLVYWRRQSSFVTSISLPAGVMIARPGKRMLAFLIDLLPGGAVAYWWFHEPLMKFYQEAGTLPPEQLEALMPGEVTTALLMTRVIYTVYCLAFELAWSKTPGKWLLGCTVLSETVSRPTPLQFFVRNMSRLIELELRYRIFLPFLLVLFFTRNRQRVGDLLARTIVVERDYSIVPEAEKPEEEGET